MKIFKVFSLFLFLSFSDLNAQESEINQDISLQDSVLSLRYTRGAALLYDCEDAHWVCTGEFEYEGCLKKREFELKEKENIFSCVPTRVFSSVSECIKEQKRITSASYAVDGCKK